MDSWNDSLESSLRRAAFYFLGLFRRYPDSTVVFFFDIMTSQANTIYGYDTTRTNRAINVVEIFLDTDAQNQAFQSCWVTK
jgi:hypothetical protein